MISCDHETCSRGSVSEHINRPRVTYDDFYTPLFRKFHLNLFSINPENAIIEGISENMFSVILPLSSLAPLL